MEHKPGCAEEHETACACGAIQAQRALEIVECASCKIKTPLWNTCMVKLEIWCLKCVVEKIDKPTKAQ